MCAENACLAKNARARKRDNTNPQDHENTRTHTHNHIREQEHTSTIMDYIRFDFVGLGLAWVEVGWQLKHRFATYLGMIATYAE